MSALATPEQAARAEAPQWPELRRVVPAPDMLAMGRILAELDTLAPVEARLARLDVDGWGEVAA